MKKIFLLSLVGMFFLNASCNPKEANLTQQTKMSEAIDIIASPSAVFAECYTKNSVGGAGGNVLNPICDSAYCLYERIYVDNVCKERYKPEDKYIKCFTQFVGKKCNTER